MKKWAIAVGALALLGAGAGLWMNQAAADDDAANAVEGETKPDCACGKDKAAANTSKEISTDTLKTALASGSVKAFDANGARTRKKFGVIAGATLLSSYNEYAASELPSDKAAPLAFYCANTQCSASDRAADRAVALGYTNVKIYRDGIAGWVKSGGNVTAFEG